MINSFLPIYLNLMTKNQVKHVKKKINYDKELKEIRDQIVPLGEQGIFPHKPEVEAGPPTAKDRTLWESMKEEITIYEWVAAGFIVAGLILICILIK